MTTNILTLFILKGNKKSCILNIFMLKCRTSGADNRGCKRRKTAAEESPGFTGQDAG